MLEAIEEGSQLNNYPVFEDDQKASLDKKETIDIIKSETTEPNSDAIDNTTENNNITQEPVKIPETTSVKEKECILDTTLPKKERIVEYIQEYTPGEEVCVKPERLPEVYCPFYARPPIPKVYTPLPEEETILISPSYEERVERTFEDTVEKKLDTSISEIVELQNEIVEKTKKAKKKQQYLKKVIEVEYKKGKKKNTKIIDELKEEYEKAAKRTEELEVEKEKSENIIKEALNEIEHVKNTKHETNELEKLLEKSIDEERTIQHSELQHIVKIKKMSKEAEMRVNHFCEEESHEIERRDNLNATVKKIQKKKKQVLELLKVKLQELKDIDKYEEDTRDRLCEIKKALITNDNNLKEIETEDKNTERRIKERESEKVLTVQRVQEDREEVTEENRLLEVGKKYLSASERRLSQIKKKQKMIQKLLTQEKVTVKKDVNRRKAVITDYNDTTKRLKKVQEELKKQHSVIEEVHDERIEKQSAIQEMLQKLEEESHKSSILEESTLSETSIKESEQKEFHKQFQSEVE